MDGITRAHRRVWARVPTRIGNRGSRVAGSLFNDFKHISKKSRGSTRVALPQNERKQMPKRQKAAPFDGLGPRERKKIDSAIRQVWYRSKARALCVSRCTDKDGFTRCEKCRARTPKLKVDHITPCGPVDSDGFMVRLFCPSAFLQGLCVDCHQLKTNMERVEKDTGGKRRRKPAFLDAWA